MVVHAVVKVVPEVDEGFSTKGEVLTVRCLDDRIPLFSVEEVLVVHQSHQVEGVAVIVLRNRTDAHPFLSVELEVGTV